MEKAPSLGRVPTRSSSSGRSSPSASVTCSSVLPPFFARPATGLNTCLTRERSEEPTLGFFSLTLCGLPSASHSFFFLASSICLSCSADAELIGGFPLLGVSFAGGLVILHLVQESAHEVAPRRLAGMASLGAHSGCPGLKRGSSSRSGDVQVVDEAAADHQRLRRSRVSFCLASSCLPRRAALFFGAAFTDTVVGGFVNTSTSAPASSDLASFPLALTAGLYRAVVSALAGRRATVSRGAMQEDPGPQSSRQSSQEGNDASAAAWGHVSSGPSGAKDIAGNLQLMLDKH